jgi:signal transduction histidine kinase
MNKQSFNVFDELLDGIQVINHNLAYVYLNEAAHRQLGLDPAVADGSDFRTHCQSRGWNALLQLAETCLEEQSAGRKILAVHLPGGHQHHLVLRLEPIRAGLIITSAIIAENATSDWRDNKFRLLFEEMKQSFMVLKAVRNPNGQITDLRITALNTAAANAINRSPTEVVGALRSEALGPPDEKSLLLYERVINHGEHFQQDHAVPGTDIHVRMSLFRPGPDHLAILSTDVTELKKTERKLKKLNESLGYIVEERTEALREALDREIASNAMKSTFLSMASHELDTPLASIQLSLDVLEKYNTGEHQAERELYHEHIRKEAQNLLSMLMRIKRESPVGNEDKNLDKEQVNVKALATEIAHELSLLARGQQKILVSHQGENTVLVDGGILRRILINLLSNAVKYSKKDVMLRSSVEDGRLYLMVRDHGIGIPTQEQDRVFSKNFRAANTGNVIGTGLGLSLVHTYVQLLKGDIDFESREGVGTTFWVAVPAEVRKQCEAKEVAIELKMSLRAIELSAEVLQARHLDHLDEESVRHLKNIQEASAATIAYINKRRLPAAS